MEEKKEVVSTGIEFTGLLQLTFIILKLCKVITWKWVCVLLPTIISTGLAILILIIALILAIVC